MGPGLIPARAGNTFLKHNFSHILCGSSPLARGTPAPCPPRAHRLVAHPRSRGEHLRHVHYSRGLAGSSPLARGTRRRKGASSPLPGLIPARAGNTAEQQVPVPVPGAHPRSRGEHQEPTPSKCSSTGSSPLARGTPTATTTKPHDSGLIPARAGNTYRHDRCTRRQWAHPRSRGEHATRLASGSRRLGSSPLARGTLYGVSTDITG